MGDLLVFIRLLKKLIQYITRYVSGETIMTTAVIVGAVGAVYSLVHFDIIDALMRGVVAYLAAIELLYTDSES